MNQPTLFDTRAFFDLPRVGSFHERRCPMALGSIEKVVCRWLGRFAAHRFVKVESTGVIGSADCLRMVRAQWIVEELDRLGGNGEAMRLFDEEVQGIIESEGGIDGLRAARDELRSTEPDEEGGPGRDPTDPI